MSAATSGALTLGAVHAVVDGACAFVLFRWLDAPGTAVEVVITWIVVYDALAFLGQVPLGIVADRLRADRTVALAGLGLVLLAIGSGPLPPVAAVIAGVGNALFHVGCGAHVLDASGPRARDIGLFVGPGAIGLALGIVLGRGRLPAHVVLALCLIAGGWVVARVVTGRERRLQSGAALTPALWLCCALLLATVALRSLIGDSVSGAWRAQSLAVVLALAAAATLGKMLGGLLADHLGWTGTAGVALAFAAPILAAGLRYPIAAVAGMLLVQVSMPLTVKAVHLILPDRPALAFALPSGALLLGAAPGLLSVRPLSSEAPLFLAAGLSAVAIVAALRLLSLSPSESTLRGPSRGTALQSR